MAYTDSRGFTDSQDNQKSFNEKYVDNDSGPYIATVKTTADPLRMGRLGVNIAALTNTTDPKPSQITWCQYLSPFYGVKSLRAVSKSDPYSFKDTQQSYGLWAVPPDIDTTVLVIFAKGENQNANAFWMGCVQDPLTNQMVPGNGSTDKTRVAANNTDFAQNKQELYGTDVLPAGEKNRNMLDPGDTVSSADKWNYPINDALADQLQSQGLVQDTVRGTTTSSARRESPSRVFGWNTPGRLKEDGTPRNIGIGGSPELVERETGHSFVMDDGAVDGTNQLTRLRTASGHQLLMHDTDGVVYLANGSGKAFIEMDKDGTVSVYADGGINLRSGQDFNLHSDTNINFHAKGTINFTSENHLALNAEGYLFAMGEKGVLSSSQKGSVRTFARDGISSDTAGSQLHGARGGDIHLAASGSGRRGGQIHFNSISPSDKWGPGWLEPDAVGIKVTGGGLIDVDPRKPFRAPKASGVDKFGNTVMERGLQVNKKPGKTTVTDFVTHEPYDRQSSTNRKKKLVNEAIAQIQKNNPELTAEEVQLIKEELSKQPTVKAVADELSKIVKLNDKIELPKVDLDGIISKANTIQNLIDNPKQTAINFVSGLVQSYEGRAIVRHNLRKIGKFFGLGGGGRDKDDIA